MAAQDIRSFMGEHAFLSNFHYEKGAPVHLLDREFVDAFYGGEQVSAPTAEHAFQAAKCADPIERRTMLDMPTAKDAKRFGCRVTMRPDWNDVRIAAMAGVVRSKFAYEPLAVKLLATGSGQLLEGNPWGDRFWGVGSDDRRGANWLGRILMLERARLAAMSSL